MNKLLLTLIAYSATAMFASAQNPLLAESAKRRDDVQSVLHYNFFNYRVDHQSAYSIREVPQPQGKEPAPGRATESQKPITFGPAVGDPGNSGQVSLAFESDPKRPMLLKEWTARKFQLLYDGRVLIKTLPAPEAGASIFQSGRRIRRIVFINL